LPPKNVLLADRFNSSKQDGHEGDEECGLHACVAKASVVGTPAYLHLGATLTNFVWVALR
jgi:hypothetical protein